MGRVIDPFTSRGPSRSSRWRGRERDNDANGAQRKQLTNPSQSYTLETLLRCEIISKCKNCSSEYFLMIELTLDHGSRSILQMDITRM